MGECALYHAETSLELCKSNNIGDFDLAFAYEAIARVFMVNKDYDQMKKYLDEVLKAAKDIEKNEDREYLVSELKSIK